MKREINMRTLNLDILFGWSYGKEKLKNDEYDVYKGSYYNNPQYDVPTEDPELITKYPEVCLPNIWPKDDFPSLEPAFKSLGNLICEVGYLVTRSCDRCAKMKFKENYEDGILERTLRESRSGKARLLYYYPILSQEERSIDSWCGWHNDHGLITGLAPAYYQYVDDNSDEEIRCPDPYAGLYVKNRKGEILRVRIPKDCLAFQIGLTAQVVTGGYLRATPHAVRALQYPDSIRICRSTFAVFMQPNFDFTLNTPIGVKGKDTGAEFFEDGMNFGDFGGAVIKAYY